MRSILTPTGMRGSAAWCPRSRWTRQPARSAAPSVSGPAPPNAAASPRRLPSSTASASLSSSSLSASGESCLTLSPSLFLPPRSPTVPWLNSRTGIQIWSLGSHRDDEESHRGLASAPTCASTRAAVLVVYSQGNLSHSVLLCISREYLIRSAMCGFDAATPATAPVRGHDKVPTGGRVKVPTLD